MLSAVTINMSSLAAYYDIICFYIVRLLDFIFLLFLVFPCVAVFNVFFLIFFHSL